MDDALATALSDAFSGRPVERVTGVGPSWNGANETVGVVFSDGARVFCKVAIDGDGRRIARERAVLRYVTDERPLAAPEVLAADPDAAVPYLITAPAPGRELSDLWEAVGDESLGGEPVSDSIAGEVTGDGPRDAIRTALLRRVGATLATLHTERFETAGETVGLDATADGGTALAIEAAPWPDVLLATIERTREIGTSDRLASHYDAVIDCVESNRDRLRDAPAALLHGDVAMPNLFVTEESADGPEGDAGPDGVVPIDWELAHVGDPARDLVRAEDQLLNGFDTVGPERFAEALYAGYRERAGGLPPGFDDRRSIYRVVRMLGRSGFVDQWSTYLDEPTASLVERADAELEARLDAVWRE
ncbi:aminoglycoside phosphotransferase [Halorubrum aidingense JCM 13560]|uniref:Aminoglycoside phosphotransferase n=1 Tax=Halorubrum aidingense JCM 13560 TaxID=1230454 RepID=M0PIU4_9EURY|nr:aminoglycoside phosphotransferase family protein [Halorubrum aidingense]EMA68675.1 aminoglycoside phosphotransferase [Halorubrum aidingense JCM 13560]